MKAIDPLEALLAEGRALLDAGGTDEQWRDLKCRHRWLTQIKRANARRARARRRAR